MPNDRAEDLFQRNEEEDLEEWELAYLALTVGANQIQKLADRNPEKGSPKAQVDNANFDHAHSWNFAFNVLLECNNKTDGSRKV